MKDIKKITPQVWLRRAILVVLDAALILFSFYFALLLRADGAVEAAWWPHNRALLYDNLPWIVALYLISFLVGGLYSTLWKYAGERDLIRLGGMIAVPTGIVYFVNHGLIHGVLFDSANAMAAVLIFLLVGGSRLAWRLFLNHPIGERMRGVPVKDPNRPVLIVGAGEAGAWAINVCKSNESYGHPVVAVDDNPAKFGQTIHGVPVRGTLEQIPQICEKYNIHSIIIAIPTLRGSKLNHVIDLCVSTHCAVQILSDSQLVGAGFHGSCRVWSTLFHAPLGPPSGSTITGSTPARWAPSISVSSLSPSIAVSHGVTPTRSMARRQPLGDGLPACPS